MASRDPNDLVPELRLAWESLRLELLECGYEAFLTCTYRPQKEQAKLYAQGRTEPGKIVTWAKPGESKHNKCLSEAFDIAILDKGKLNWDLESDAWKKAGEIGLRLGLEWGGTWGKKAEGCHFQLP